MLQKNCFLSSEAYEVTVKAIGEKCLLISLSSFSYASLSFHLCTIYLFYSVSLFAQLKRSHCFSLSVSAVLYFSLYLSLIFSLFLSLSLSLSISFLYVSIYPYLSLPSLISRTSTLKASQWQLLQST